MPRSCSTDGPRARLLATGLTKRDGAPTWPVSDWWPSVVFRSVSGEEAHAKGADGARRAKLYLDGTSRAVVHWVNPEGRSVEKLTFPWADDSIPFSFDIGGQMIGEELDKLEFFGESKNYVSAQDQGTHYKKFLAQCYRAFHLLPSRCDLFLWITWSPFGTTVWDDLTNPVRVKEAVELRLPQASEDGEVHLDRCEEVASRLRILVLSDWHEKLIPTREHLAEIRRYDTERGL